MDGPSVNWKFLDLLQKEQRDKYGGQQLLVTHSCGLHTMHNSFKACFASWDLENILSNMYRVFKESPARHEDYIIVNGLTKEIFPMKFCGHRWLENGPVEERAMSVWDKVVTYVTAVKQKKVAHPKNASFDVLERAVDDRLLMARFQFFLSIGMMVIPYLTRYQCDEPALPYMASDLMDLLTKSLRHFIKKEILEGYNTMEKLSIIDVIDKNIHMHHHKIDVGFSAQATIQVLS